MAMSSLHKKLGVLKLKDLYWFHIGINCYEYFNNKEFPTKLKDKFCKKCDMSNRITRTEKKPDLYYRPPILVSSYKQPRICGSAFWNSLLSEIRESTSITTFKNGLRQYFLENTNKLLFILSSVPTFYVYFTIKFNGQAGFGRCKIIAIKMK